jgi:hypothetical protein
MLHGMLLDQGREYFIVHTAANPSAEPTDASTSEWHHGTRASPLHPPLRGAPLSRSLSGSV